MAIFLGEFVFFVFDHHFEQVDHGGQLAWPEMADHPFAVLDGIGVALLELGVRVQHR